METIIRYGATGNKISLTKKSKFVPVNQPKVHTKRVRPHYFTNLDGTTQRQDGFVITRIKL